MIKFTVAVFIGFGALLGSSAQAAPVALSSSIQNQVTGDAVKVWHCRRWSGGWGCGGYRRRRWWR
jgi:hypothetical protein